MSIPQRPFEPFAGPFAAPIAQGFAFCGNVTRDPDELPPREYAQEMLAPVLQRLRQGDLAAARRAAERLSAQRPDKAFFAVELARLYLTEGAPDEAVAPLERILSKNAGHIEALKLLGFARLQQGDPPQALAFFNEAAKLSPADSFAQINRHALLRKLRPASAKPGPGSALRPVVATSLPPVNVEVSRMAVDSWLARGFEVLSVNTARERERLAPHFPDIAFSVCEDTAKEALGKDYQYLDALFDGLYATGRPLCGVINADIVLRGEKTVWDQLCAAASDRLVYGSRVNVDRLDARHGALLEPGFDFFFFPARFLPRFPRTGFIIGQPAWDLFVPAFAAARGMERAFCYSPVALHVEHKVQWSRTNNTRFMVMALSWLAPEYAALLSGDPGCRTYLKLFTSGLSQLLNRAPKAGAAPLFCVSPEMDACLAAVDPFYWERKTKETFLLLRQG